MSLIAWYRLDGNALDASGNGYNATKSTGSYVNGKINQAGYFNCTSSSDFDVSTNIIPIGGEITISFWANVHQSTKNSLFDGDDASGNRTINIHLLYDNGNTYWDCGNSESSYDRVHVSSPVGYDEWHHWTFVKDVSIGWQAIYLDGDLLISSTNETNPINETVSWAEAGAFHDIEATIDDVRIYDNKISIKEIKELSKAKVLHYTFNKPTYIYSSTDFDDETINDITGNDNDGDTDIGNLPQWTNNSKLGNGAYEFDGIDDRILTKNVLYIGDNHWTVCTWYYPKSSDNYGHILTSDQTQDDFACKISKNLQPYFYAGSSFRTSGGDSTSINLNEWSHLAYVFDGSSLKIYVNGVLEVNETNITPDTVPVSKFTIQGGSDEFVNAIHDDVRLYTTALSSDEIKEICHTRASLDDDGNYYTNQINEIKHQPLLVDYTVWEDGQTGNVGSFIDNGSASENHRLLGDDPWGKETVVWEARPDSSSDGDGGWNHTLDVDQNKMYRISTWVWRNTNDNGKFYLGVRAYDDSGSRIDVKYRDSTSTTSNPYFYNTRTGIQEGRWELIVGHVWPYGSGEGSDHPDSGRYTIDGKYGEITRDFVWIDGTSRGTHRSYLYYGTNVDQRQRWVYPRMDVIDGTEPSINDLLSGFDSIYIDKIREIGGTNSFSLNITNQLTKSNELSEVGPTNGLVAYYTLNGDALDFSGNNLHGTETSAVYEDAILGKGISDGYITVPNDPKLQLIEETSISFWIYVKSISTRSTFIDKAYGGEYTINIEEEPHLRFYSGLGNGNSSPYVSVNSSKLNTGEWYHAVIVRNHDTATWYLNGKYDNDKTNSDFVGSTSNNDLRLLTGYTGDPDIILDDVRFYNTVLSPEEVNILYEINNTNTKMKLTSRGIYIKGEFKENI